ncbi:hypothetical protein [Streptomyces cupreus]|uniref:Uncharacterized protein n=1 Tax=Streptomyces cupreus TaxID=2759956 RepID=A0A7X1J3R4_9ACTN|nr:hypothetical protein [Streptomyces cupreus]MBC2903614.1 hypothetical protein [Streptomyces cupreus]
MGDGGQRYVGEGQAAVHDEAQASPLLFVREVRQPAGTVGRFGIRMGLTTPAQSAAYVQMLSTTAYTAARADEDAGAAIQAGDPADRQRSLSPSPEGQRRP